MTKRIGWIGTGVMGQPMCAHLIQNGYDMAVFNRTREKADDLVDAGAVWRESPRAVAEKSDIVFTIVGFPQDVREIYFGDTGIFAGMRKGGTVVDMTTSEPSLAAQIAAQAGENGVAALDAPVSGGDVGARQGTLAIVVGGDRDAFDETKPLFDILGDNVAYLGPAGAGQHTKMSNQTLIASTMIGVVESLLYAWKAGLDPNDVIDVIGRGAASSWSINNLGRRIVAGDYNPGFYIRHFVKDMGIALREAERMNLSLPGLSLARQFYVAAMGMGFEDLGTQGLYKVLARLNGVA